MVIFVVALLRLDASIRAFFKQVLPGADGTSPLAFARYCSLVDMNEEVSEHCFGWLFLGLEDVVQPKRKRLFRLSAVDAHHVTY